MAMVSEHIKIGGMQCSFCAESIRKAFSRMDGVGDVGVSLSHEEVLVRYDARSVSVHELRETLRSLGFTVRDPGRVLSLEEEEAEVRGHRDRLLWAGAFFAAALALMVGMWAGAMAPWFRWALLGLGLAMVFGVGWPILRMAFASLRRGVLNQHVLMECGALGGLAGGAVGFFRQPWPTADFLGATVFVTAYHLLSGYVSLVVRARSSRAIRTLLDLQPPTARVVRDGTEQELPVEEVTLGELVRVRPGESIPVDGVVVEGRSGVNQSLVTGESMPVEKAAGDEVIGGSVNQVGTLLIRVTKVGEESFLRQVARSIQEARALKPGILQLVERVLRWFVPGVLVAAALAFSLWTLGAWLMTGNTDFTRAVFATLAVLVMGYPCALGMATPLAMIRGGGMAARRGILMRSGEAFQVFKDVRKVVLDKTGTLTRGEPRVVQVVPAPGVAEEEVLALAAAAEKPSEHPLARAIQEKTEETGISIPMAEEFEAIPGLGVRATVGGQALLVGSPRFLVEEEVDLAPLDPSVGEMEESGHTVVIVAKDGEMAGAIAVADTTKDDAAEAVARMKAAGLEPVMLTGDNWRTARAVAAQVGITEVLAAVLPDEKAAKVRELQKQGYRVAMVGDGINDAPALMQADVGIAIGAGTDIAIESADVVLVADRLGGVLDAYQIAKSSYRKTVQNVTLAFAFNVVGVPAAVTGLMPPVWAMIAMGASVTTVLLNSFGGKLIPAQRRGAAQPFEEVQNITLMGPTIHCAACVDATRPALAPHGVKNVEADVRTGLVEVTSSPLRHTPKEIRVTIGALGYRVGEMRR